MLLGVYTGLGTHLGGTFIQGDTVSPKVHASELPVHCGCVWQGLRAFLICVGRGSSRLQSRVTHSTLYSASHP